MKAAEWIDALKLARGWETDYRVAKELDVSHTTLSRYRTNPESTMDDGLAAKVADALDLDPHIIVIDQVKERTPVDAVRTSLAELLDRLKKGKRGPLKGGGAASAQVDITKTASAADPGRLELQPVAKVGRKPRACASEYTSYEVGSVPQQLLAAMRAFFLAPPKGALGA